MISESFLSILPLVYAGSSTYFRVKNPHYSFQKQALPPFFPLNRSYYLFGLQINVANQMDRLSNLIKKPLEKTL